MESTRARNSDDRAQVALVTIRLQEIVENLGKETIQQRTAPDAPRSSERTRDSRSSVSNTSRVKPSITAAPLRRMSGQVPLRSQRVDPKIVHVDLKSISNLPVEVGYVKTADRELHKVTARISEGGAVNIISVPLALRLGLNITPNIRPYISNRDRALIDQGTGDAPSEGRVLFESSTERRTLFNVECEVCGYFNEGLVLGEPFLKSKRSRSMRQSQGRTGGGID